MWSLCMYSNGARSLNDLWSLWTHTPNLVACRHYFLDSSRQVSPRFMFDTQLMKEYLGVFFFFFSFLQVVQWSTSIFGKGDVDWLTNRIQARCGHFHEEPELSWRRQVFSLPPDPSMFSSTAITSELSVASLLDTSVSMLTWKSSPCRAGRPESWRRRQL